MNKRNFYLKLGANNIKQNGRFYIPYLLTGIITVAMFYIISAMANNQNLPGGASVQLVMTLGVVVVGLFGTLFLFYTNNFLIRRRKKELGLYNILGMEKKHIARVLFHETAISAGISIVGGMLVGLLLNKLMYMILLKMINLDVKMQFQLQLMPFLMTACLFVFVYILILLYNRVQISKAKPVDLLHSENFGEKEPKTKWVLVVIGVVTLGAGYFMAQASKDTVTAILLFFIAVILVIIGTYCLFTAGSIAILKGLKKNKKYYYKKEHFASVSGMIFRMKQNAKGLANICILSTMVLVTISTTVSLYAGTNDIINKLYPADLSIRLYDATDTKCQDVKDAINDKASEMGVNIKDFEEYESLEVAFAYKSDELVLDNDHSSAANTCDVVFLTAETYNEATGKNLKLGEGQVAVSEISGSLDDHFKMLNKTFNVVERFEGEPINGGLAIILSNAFYVVVDNDDTMKEIYEAEKAEYDAYSPMGYTLNFNIAAKDDATKTEFISQATSDAVHVARDGITYQNRGENAEGFYQICGGFLFLGIFLGILFLIFTVLIIYYKQIIEGYDDRERFVIMEKVGMDKKLIKSSIRSQVLTMFILPILAAAVHLAFAFPMLTLIMRGFSLVNTTLFGTCTLITVGIFTIIYAIVYVLTARTYYKIVSRD